MVDTSTPSHPGGPHPVLPPAVYWLVACCLPLVAALAALVVIPALTHAGVDDVDFHALQARAGLVAVLLAPVVAFLPGMRRRPRADRLAWTVPVAVAGALLAPMLTYLVLILTYYFGCSVVACT